MTLQLIICNATKSLGKAIVHHQIS